LLYSVLNTRFGAVFSVAKVIDETQGAWLVLDASFAKQI
jgi:hypothetical protein